MQISSFPSFSFSFFKFKILLELKIGIIRLPNCFRRMPIFLPILLLLELDSRRAIPLTRPTFSMHGERSFELKFSNLHLWYHFFAISVASTADFLSWSDAILLEIVAELLLPLFLKI